MNKLFKNIWLLMGIILVASYTASCKDDIDPYGDKPIVVDKIYLQDAESSITDREVDFVRLGQIIRIEGSGFLGMRRIYVNGYETYFNPVLISDNSMLLQVSGKTPTIEAKEDERNTIKFVKTAAEKTIPFLIREAAPTISSISHTLPLAGEQITIYGAGLVEITEIIFPGDVVVTEDIVSDEKGKFVTVTVPSGLTKSGSILVKGANGGAYSPAYFNVKEGVILDFDGNGQQGFWGWSDTGSMINDDDLMSDVVGEVNVSQGNYVAHRPTRIAEFSPAANRRSEVWTAGNDVDDWRGQLTPFIPATTPVSQVAFQFDVFVPQPWANSGYLKILLYNSYNGGEWSGNVYNYVPWIDKNAVVPFVTESWTTVTVPFNKFYAFSDSDKDFTFEDVLVAREESSWANFGFYFENSDFTLADITGNSADEGVEFESKATSAQVYTDNWRVVSLHTPTFSDYPDEVEDEVEE